METRLTGKRMAWAGLAAIMVCSAGMAGETDSKSIAKSDATPALAQTQIECKARKRTSESWPDVNRSRIDQEMDQHNLANGGRSSSMGPPLAIKRAQEAAEARNVAKALSEECRMETVEPKDPEAGSEQKAAKAKRAGPR